MDNWKLTPAELERYAERHGDTAAANLLLLVGYDGYTGDFDDAFDYLTTGLTTKRQHETIKNAPI